MKKILIVCLIALNVSPVMANTNLDNCNAMAKIAGGLMTARQQGTQMSEIFTRIKNNAVTDDEKVVASILMDMTIIAYEQPRFNTERAREEAIDEFRNSVFLQCVKEVTDGQST